MYTKGRLVAGSHNRNEFVLINADEVERVKLWAATSGKALSKASINLFCAFKMLPCLRFNKENIKFHIKVQNLISHTQKYAPREVYKNKKYLPLDLHSKKPEPSADV
ncbi:hypothetical protein L6452_29835 [Arctium lappa]|uniref:Uncharacterized protein n=1 Tax=Arctium lappa TaxID=4217 RepID=A0ACB8ZLR9_ARCLA|nr:hypothetical protein L6452_29835 [Arctium lappa]